MSSFDQFIGLSGLSLKKVIVKIDLNLIDYYKL